MDLKEFDALIDRFAEAERPIFALCAADLGHIREEYVLCEAEEISSNDAEGLARRINEFSAAPHEIYLIALSIPKDALDPIVQRLELRGTSALLCAIEREGYAAVIGGYNKKHKENENERKNLGKRRKKTT